MRKTQIRAIGPAWPILLSLAALAALAAACAPPPQSAATTTPTVVLGETPVTIAATVTAPAAPAPTASAEPTAQAETPVYGYTVVNEYPHDPNAFTQGLVYEDGIFYEGTGLEGRSSLRKVKIETGQVLQIHNLAPEYFGEGIAVVGDRIWQLTWQERTAFLYDKGTFEQLDTVAYPTEGWGLTYDGERLIMSDGTANLYFRDPATFELLGQVAVTDRGQPIVRLNELEYIEGQVFANVWQTDRIAIIDPASGNVDAWLNLTGLLDREDATQPYDVLNGIAYDAAGRRLFVTGKWWPKVYEIEIIGDAAEINYLPLMASE